jgi:hypothetical protein
LPPKSYCNKSDLELPILIDSRVQPSLREVQLFGKEDPARPWTFLDRAAPTQKTFSFRAPHDGEYWLTIVTVDRAGRQTPSPAEMSKEPPGVIVVVDTQAPQLELCPLPDSGEGTCVRCLVNDDNLDPARTRFEFQTQDETWRVVEALPGQPNIYRIPPQGRITGKVRAEVRDKAGNVSSREATVCAATPPMSLYPSLPAESRTEPTGQAGKGRLVSAESGPASPPAAQLEIARVSHTESDQPFLSPGQTMQESVHQAQKIAPPKMLPQVPLGQPVNAEPAVPHEAANAPGARQVVNSRRVFLNYRIDQTGPSGVGRVQIWMTRDRGQSWESLGEDPDRTSPAEVLLPGEGLYGITLVVSNGRGFGGAPPAAGDTPDWWIEVDLTKPVAKLLSVQPSPNGEPGVMVITWNARDKNLLPEPVDLYWSAGREGPWMVIAKGLKNDRQYRWSVPQDVGAHAYLRMTVTDQAKNITECITPEAVAIDDMSRPRIRVVGISTAAPDIGPVLLPDH